MIFKLDQTLLDKYLPGKSIKKTLQTPFKNVRAHIVEDKITSEETAFFVATAKSKVQVSSYVAQVAALKGWSTSMYSEGSHLVCILYSGGQ